MYLIPRNLLEHSELPEKFSFESGFLAQKVRKLRPQAFFADGYFIDIGIPADYERAQLELPEWE